MATVIRERELLNSSLSEHSNPSVENVPKAGVIILSPNGKGGFKEQPLTPSEIKDKILISLERQDELRKKLNNTSAMLSSLRQERKHGSGRLRPSREITNIQNNVRKAQKKLEGRIDAFEADMNFLKRAGYIAQTSPFESPLKIKPVADGEIEVSIDSQQLSQEEVEWREMVGKHAPSLWSHPIRELLGQSFSLQRAAYQEFQNQGLGGPRQKRWEEFKSEHVDDFPETGEIKELMSEIAARFARYEGWDYGRSRRRPRR